MKRFVLWTTLVLVLAAAAVLPTVWALHRKAETASTLKLPNPNVVHVNVQPSGSATPGN